MDLGGAARWRATVIIRGCLRTSLGATVLVTGVTLVATAEPAAATRTVEAEVIAPSPPGVEGSPGERETGSGRGNGPARRLDAEEERDIATAATWHLDPRLLRPHPTDSLTTAAARERLAAINARVGGVMETYDDARAAAQRAGAAAREARAELEAAREAERAAEARYRADRALLVSALTESYLTSQAGALSLMLNADSDTELISGLTVLGELGRIQTDAVEAAQVSRDRLREATAAVAVAERTAEERLAVSRSALADADDARSAVLRDVRAARRIVQQSEIADRAARRALAGGYDGPIRFPLAPGTPFVDQDNFGGHGGRWAAGHTGDDLSAACGAPVRAVTDGTVIVRTDQGWSGPWLVMVSTGPGRLATWYAHMQALTVADGERVRAGEQIGRVGTLGNSTGCHLHFEVHPAGGSIYQDDTDPGEWLRRAGAYPAAA